MTNQRNEDKVTDKHKAMASLLNAEADDWQISEDRIAEILAQHFPESPGVLSEEEKKFISDVQDKVRDIFGNSEEYTPDQMFCATISDKFLSIIQKLRQSRAAFVEELADSAATQFANRMHGKVRFLSLWEAEFKYFKQLIITSAESVKEKAV